MTVRLTLSRRAFVAGTVAATVARPSLVRAADVPAGPWGCIGDSMTHGVVGAANSIPTLMSQATGVAFDDLGVIAQTSTEIVARVGATPIRVSVPHATIPASGEVPLTMLEPLVLNNTGPDAVIDSQPVQRALTGTLNGVPGYLRRDLRGGLPNQQVPIRAVKFVRLAEGEPVRCYAGSLFVPDAQALYRHSPLIVRMGYNNREEYEQVVGDHQALFDWNTRAPRAMLLLDPPVSYSDSPIERAASARIARFLRRQATKLDVHYFSVHTYAASRRGLRDAGIRPTDDDLAAIADGRTPKSATTGDGLHYNAAMNAAVAARLVAELRAVGYL